MSPTAELAGVEQSLRRRFRIVETPVQVGNRRLSILHPESAEDLIDERAFEQDERLPYWAELWPSARVLGEHVLAMTGHGRTLLELGCGSGLVATCAALAGFDVVASDYYEDAPSFARVNAARNGAVRTTGLVLDWRHLPETLPTFDVILASDVLYERTYGPVVAKAIGAALAHDGIAIVADPGRVGREGFVRALQDSGLALNERVELPFVEGKIRQTISLLKVVRQRSR